ncbi:MAG: class I SAM-dependent methyltransferase [Desulfobulbaceae bacterium]|nr:class I SAM-dependent methyltransferase [Desulfobulbaceae bacterium]
MNKTNKLTQQISFAACPACGAKSFEKLLPIRQEYIFGACGQCGLTYTAPFPTNLELEQIYKGFGQTCPIGQVFDRGSDFSAIARDRYSFITRKQDVTAKQRLLEIGSSYGLFLRHFLDTAWETHGVEPSVAPAELSRQEWGLHNINNCIFAEVEYPPATFDIICSFHVIEHLGDPIGMLQKIRLLLKPEGRLFLVTPNLEKIKANISEYYFLYYGLHLMFFTPLTIKCLLCRCGFEVISIEQEVDRIAESGSMIIEAELSTPVVGNCPEEIQHASRYAYKLAEMKEKLKKSFFDLVAAGHRIAIFGGGSHTKGLLACFDGEFPKIELIFDDDPAKNEQELSGIPIVPFRDQACGEIDVMVVSSLASEASILDRLSTDVIINKKRIRCYGIYRDFLK